jgi:hypothetical protein
VLEEPKRKTLDEDGGKIRSIVEYREKR